MTTTTKSITLDYLSDYADKFLQKNYNIQLEIPIERNNRLKRALGVYKHSKNNDLPLKIELAGFLLEYGSESTILGILKHELIHYALHVCNKPFKDGHPYFENELKKHNVPSTNELKVGKYYKLKCNGCNKAILTDNKKVILQTQNYRSRCCKSKLTYVNTIIYNGSEGLE